MEAAIGSETEPGRIENRQWPWVFRALWSAAPKGSISPCESNTIFDTSRSSCHVRVPDTILFEGGEPRKWIGTSPEGNVVRKSFISTWYGIASGDIERHLPSFRDAPSDIRLRKRLLAIKGNLAVASDQSILRSKVLEESEVLQRMDIIHKAFLSFAFPSTPKDAPVCVTMYLDGTTELLSDKSLRTLSGCDSWRSSLSGLQAYVFPVRMATGTFVRRRHHSNQRRRRLEDRDISYQSPPQTPLPSSVEDPDLMYSDFDSTDDSSSDSSSLDISDGPKNVPRARDNQRMMLDRATSELAFAIEKSYARHEKHTPRSIRSRDPDASRESDKISFGRNVTSNDNGAVTNPKFVPGIDSRHRQSRPKSRLRVRRLQAKFVIDKNGFLWFSKATRVLVQPVARQPREDLDGVEPCTKRKELRQKVKFDASVASRELLAVVSLARRRGFNAEEVFRHFDSENGAGRAGKNEVIRGMANLGILISEESAAVLIDIVTSATGSSCASVEESEPKRRRGKPGKGSAEATSGLSGRKTYSARKPSAASQPVRDYFTANDLWHFGSIPTFYTTSDTKNRRRTSFERRDGNPSAYSCLDQALPRKSPSCGKTKDKMSTSTKGRRIATFRTSLAVQSGEQRATLEDRITETDRSYGRETRDEPSSSSPSGSDHQPQAALQTRHSSQNDQAPTMSSVSISGIDDSSPQQNILQTRGRGLPRHKQYRGAPSVALLGENTKRRPSTLKNHEEHDNETVELAYFPCKNPVAEAKNGKDRVFHVQRLAFLRSKLQLEVN